MHRDGGNSLSFNNNTADSIIVNYTDARQETLSRSANELVGAGAVAAISATLLGDPLAIYETDNFVRRLKRFLEDTAGFAETLFVSDTHLDLLTLPGQIKQWAGENAANVDLDEAKVAVGVTLYLIGRFEAALELLAEVAVKTSDPNIAVLAADAALPISQPSVALKFLELARWKIRPDNSDETRRLALVLGKIGACHDMLIREHNSGAGLGGSLRSRAIEAYEEALSYLPERQIGFVTPKTDRLDLLARARILNNLGYAKMAMGGTEPGQNTERAQARASMQEALTIRRNLEDIGPNLARVHLNIAELDRLIGNVASVYDNIASAEAALSGPGEALEHHPLHAKLANLRASQDWEEGRLREAQQGFEKALKLLQSSGLGESEDALLVRYSIAHTLISADKPGGRRYLLELHEQISERLKIENGKAREKKTLMLLEMLREDIARFPPQRAH